MYLPVFLKNRLYIIILVLFLFSCEKEKQKLPYYNSPDFTPVFIKSKKEADQKITHQIADFSFVDQHNKIVTEKNIDQKIHVANFFFTGCGSICPGIMNHMNQISKAYAKDTNVVLLSYTVTPWIDSVAKLNAYADFNRYRDPKWHLLTGRKTDIYQLARRSYFAEEDLGFSKDSSDFLHTEHFILVDGNKKIRGIYNGTLDLEIRQIIEDIQLLKEEKN